MKFIKEVFVFDKEMAFNGEVDFAVTINGADLIDAPIDRAWAMLNAHGLIKDDKFIIPMGTRVIYKIQYSGATEYKLNYNNTMITLDLALDNENEFIGEE